MEPLAYLGTAMKNPVGLVSGRAALVKGLTVIEQSIYDILSTQVGTRLFLPEYGSRLPELTFDPNDDVVEGMAGMLIEQALSRWEKRVRFIDVTVERAEDHLNLNISYRILPSIAVRSYVYPFYQRLDF